MEISEAHYLLDSSTSATLVSPDGEGKPTQLPDVMSILALKCGGRSAHLPDQSYILFSMDRPKALIKCVTSHLYECPEKIANKFRRYDYKFDLFIGDSEGVLVTDFPWEIKGSMESHGDLLSFLASHGVVDRDHRITGKECEHVTILGKPKMVHYLYSGVVLPKQEDVDGTYLCFWTSNAFDYLHQLLLHSVRNILCLSEG
jgi:hypothetical protein